MKYSKEARIIWDKDVPKEGQSLTVEGELLRSIEGLRWEAQNNGNINWDSGFEIMCNYLLQILIDEKVFDISDINQIKTDIKRITINTVSYLKELDVNELDMNQMPYVYDDLYNRLVDCVVVWGKFYEGPVVREINPLLHR